MPVFVPETPRPSTRARSPETYPGQRESSPQVTGDLARHLTDRECQVLRGLGEGVSVSSLADRYHLHESTLRGHVKSILQKLQVHSQLQAVLVGMRAGIVPEVVQDVDPVDNRRL